MSFHHARAHIVLVCCAVAGLMLGCFESRTVLEDVSDGGMLAATTKDRGALGNGLDAADAGSSNPMDAQTVCGDHRVCEQLTIENIDKVDLLFVIDNSNSMHDKQRSLTAQFPHLLETLTTGDMDGDGKPEFPPAKDLHLGVVSTDMGLVDVDGVRGCIGLGDDGLLQHTPSPELMGCAEAYPPFLIEAANLDAGTGAPQTANDLACIATLGTGGCGFEQPLEAALKALWPSVDPVTAPMNENRITFLAEGGHVNSLSHGDRENLGFLRNDPALGMSLIAVLVVSDEDDGSSLDTHHFTLMPDPSDPLSEQPLNLRNHYNPDELYPISRYVAGLQELRHGRDDLVVFGAIAGVPPDLVDAQHTGGIAEDAMAREAFYDAVLDDPRMQEQVDPASMAVPGAGNLLPSCPSGPGALAYPPRRLVETARGFGENGFVQSICASDFGPAIDTLAKHIGAQLGARCLDQPLTRGDDGLVSCKVLWALPVPGTAPGAVPNRCDTPGFEFLLPPGSGYPAELPDGSALCEVEQLPVFDAEVSVNPTNMQREGWFYDDFAATQECRRGSTARINFSPNAKPPTDVRVFLDCK